ncbi:hypothetical protein ACFFLM_21275 [Deinococcus oregonensis]|uniref:Uncharacterized protein n=1 Tax=Deinococcus oregonensis TaxID=1805970 RepID=A0ABV6B5L6_9DEIO
MNTRTMIGVLVGLAGVAGAASVLVSASKKTPAVGVQPQTTPAPGVPLTSTGQTLDVGFASGIPTVRPYDTGPVNTTYNPSGWDHAFIGVRR